MSYHLKKIAVGIETIERLYVRQKMIKETYGTILHTTRNMPKKREDLIKTGSMFWIIKRKVLVRQKILDILSVIRSDGSKGCEIELDKKLTTPNRGVKQAGFYVLIGASMPNALVEVGFISNPSEEKKLKQEGMSIVDAKKELSNPPNSLKSFLTKTCMLLMTKKFLHLYIDFYLLR